MQRSITHTYIFSNFVTICALNQKRFHLNYKTVKRLCSVCIYSMIPFSEPVTSTMSLNPTAGCIEMLMDTTNTSRTMLASTENSMSTNTIVCKVTQERGNSPTTTATNLTGSFFFQVKHSKFQHVIKDNNYELYKSY